MNEVEEYYILGKQQSLIKERRAVLRSKIITKMPSVEGYNVTLVPRRKQKVDDGALEMLLLQKGLYHKCTKEVIDHDLVEQLYLEGEITDEELRSIDGGRDITYVLSVERADKDLQKIDDGDS